MHTSPLNQFPDPPQLQPETQPQPTPVQPNTDRLVVIDAIRGMAIFGILIINMGYYAWPKVRNWGLYPIEFANSLDLYTELIARFLAKGKFYTIFSFLFGVGMAMQKDRFTAKGKPFSFFFFRRMLILLLIGAVHGFLIWNGDILFIYALLGFLLIPFQSAGPRVLFLVAGLIFSLQIFTYLGYLADGMARNAAANGGFNAMIEWFEIEAYIAEIYNTTLAAYVNGDWMSIAIVRSGEFVELLQSLPMWGPDLLVSFLLGAWSWRMGLFTRIEENRNLLKRILLWGGLIGLVTNAYSVAVYAMRVVGPEQEISMLCWFLGKFTLGYAYVAGVLLIWNSGGLRIVFEKLAPVGRMALSNYLFHSVLFTLIFNGYGLGLMGQFGEFTVFLMALAVFLIQIPLSAWVLNRFGFGPVELLWRKLSYFSFRDQMGGKNAARISSR